MIIKTEVNELNESLLLTAEDYLLKNSYQRKRRRGEVTTDEEKAAVRKYGNAYVSSKGKHICYLLWRKSAKARGIVWELTKEDLELLMVTEVCPVFGITLDYNCYSGKGTGNRNPAKASLDRLDNTKGYVPGNVWIISWRANHLKNNSSLDELKQLVVALEKQQEIN